jgi:hypothetical protein
LVALIQQPVRSAYQPPASGTFLSEQTSHQQSASSTFHSEQISTSHQPNEHAALWVDVLFLLWLLDLRKRVLVERDREKMSTDADLQRTETEAW